MTRFLIKNIDIIVYHKPQPSLDSDEHVYHQYKHILMKMISDEINNSEAYDSKSSRGIIINSIVKFTHKNDTNLIRLKTKPNKSYSVQQLIELNIDLRNWLKDKMFNMHIGLSTLEFGLTEKVNKG